MAPRIPVELIARLAGLLLVGLCAGRVIGHVARTVVAWPWPPWTSQGLLEWMAGAVLLIVDQFSLAAAGGFLLRAWAPALGLAAGVYFFLGGVWPLRWIVGKEIRRG